MSLKSAFIELLRKTPDGIADFLEVALPEPPAVSIPTTPEEAQIVQGKLAYYILDAFRPFTGLFPVELLLRIGQHSNVAEAIALSGLEYLTDSDGQQEFEIIEPGEGQTYAPGDIRLIVKGKGKVSTVQAATNDQSTPEIQTTDLLSDEGEMFYGFARLAEIGEYTSLVTVTFGDDAHTQKTASVHFTIADAGANTTNPEGKDLSAFDTACKQLDDAYQKAISAASAAEPVPQSTIDGVVSAAKSVFKGGGGTSGGGGASGSWGEEAAAIADELKAATEALTP